MKQQVKVGVVGASGRMGTEIQKQILLNKNLNLFLGIDYNSANQGFKFFQKDFSGKQISEVDVWIDFSLPELTKKLLPIARKNRTPVISGTTGLDRKLQQELKAAAKDIPVLWSSNMSMGIAVLKKAMESFSALQDFDFQIEEIHHKRKKDRPSGTAITLQEQMEKVVNMKCPDPLVIRGGGVFGIHKVFAISEDEIITFEHQAMNRSVFAAGAVRCAGWIVNKKPSFYTIEDVLFGAKP